MSTNWASVLLQMKAETWNFKFKKRDHCTIHLSIKKELIIYCIADLLLYFCLFNILLLLMVRLVL